MSTIKNFVVFSSLWDVQGKSLDTLLFNVPSMQEPNLWQKSLCTTLPCSSGSMRVAQIINIMVVCCDKLFCQNITIYSVL